MNILLVLIAPGGDGIMALATAVRSCCCPRSRLELQQRPYIFSLIWEFPV